MSDSQKEEMRLVEAAQKDLRSFEVLYDKYFEKIYKYFHFRLRNKEDSEELTSQTFEKTLTKLNIFQDQGYSFSAWLFKIAHNILVDFFRKKSKKKVIFLEDLSPGEEPSTEKEPAFIDQLDVKETVKKVKEIIKTLSPLHQEIWALKLSSDLPHRQIAETLGITENYVNVTLHRSLQVIKSKFNR